MGAQLEKIIGTKINGVRVVPLVVKIIVIFSIFLLLSNFTSNYVNLLLNRGEMVVLMNRLLVKDLKESYVFALNQHDIFFYNQDLKGALGAIEQNAVRELKDSKAVVLGVKPDGSLLFMASRLPRVPAFTDKASLEKIGSGMKAGVQEGSLNFRFNDEEYFGVYKYNQKWDVYIIRAEEQNEFYADSQRIFRNISLLILGITVVCVAVGIFLLNYILRFVRTFTNQIMKMQTHQKIELLDLSGAPNDDVAYMGAAFNSLSSTIDNLMNIFKKFVARDMAAKAYKERDIRLEGGKRELAILFTDIKGFTFMTETLGNDIIKLLNLHYSKAIRHIHDLNGDIGSIIGDALLAIFGLLETTHENKSLQAVRAAYGIQQVAAELRHEMHGRREEILKQRGTLNEAEERIYQAVMLEVGVGIDGGEVFYGTIGSDERMVNTVIGDNVNSSSRLEGLTRIYRVPIVVSQYIREEVERDSKEYRFLEIDQVQVKGKTTGKRIFWPVLEKELKGQTLADMEEFALGLQAYYTGDWKAAGRNFSRCTLPLAEEFRMRTATGKCPKDWNGIWTMKTK
jgi:adenylate cyclase